MGRVRITRPGMLSTVQDLGRPGLLHLGVPTGGAADPLSLSIGNRILGNKDNTPAIEMTMVGAAFEFHDDAVIVLAGPQASARIRDINGNEHTIESFSPCRVAKGSQLDAGAGFNGVRLYLCIAGGFQTPRVLGSASTHLPGGFGGVSGRSLRAGDTLEFAASQASPVTDTMRLTAARAMLLLDPCPNLSACAGPHADILDPACVDRFWNSDFVVSNQSDRSGIRLEPGDSHSCSNTSGRMTSEGMTWGAVQLPPDGRPIILMCDHPTTGGYPVIACVATADLPVLGQLRPGDRVRFSRVTPAEALGEYIGRCHHLDRILPSRDEPRVVQAIAAGSGLQRAHRQLSITARRVAPVSIDLNADLGEFADEVSLGRDIALLDVVTSANIACGGHAGDEFTMARVVDAALSRGVAIGAHPSYPDRANFGRVAMKLSPGEIETTMRSQLAALEQITGARSRYLVHVKPHGALYHAANTSRAVAEAIGRAAAEFGELIVLVGQARSLALEVWRAQGLAVAAEAFADRRYEADGTLLARSCEGALIGDPGQAAAQAVEIALRGRVASADGCWIDLQANTICIHSDTPDALNVAKAVRAALEAAGVSIRKLP